jgi:hypothetical protein
MNSRKASGSAVAFAAFLFVACGSTSKASFYLLENLPATEKMADAEALAIGVGPVSIPEYLDRPQLVRRGAGQVVELDEFERWAEPLEASLQRILIANLSTLLGTERVMSHPLRGSAPIAYRVAVEIDRLHPYSRSLEKLLRWERGWLPVFG